jgi:MFS family permease
MTDTGPRLPPLTTVQWLVCAMAAIGFAFDIYEILMAPLVFPPAIQELTGASPLDPATRGEFLRWVGLLFFVPAFAGGIFGLLGGYLTDRLGRRRVLTYSILLYAVSAFLAGYSTDIHMLLVLRCTTFIGVCVEFVAAVAWLAELFDDPKRRERVLAYTQAFSSVGGLLVAVAYGLAVAWSQSLPAIAMPEALSGTFGTIDPTSAHAPWRYTLMSGLIPALPLLVIRPFLPESPKWLARQRAGTLRRPSLRELFAPKLRRTTVLTTIMFACSYGAAFGAIQQVQHMVPGVPQVRAEVAAIAPRLRAENESRAQPLPEPALQRSITIAERKVVATENADITKVQEIGGLLGRVLLALLAVRILSRRSLLRVFLLPGIVVLPLVFAYAAVHDLTLLYIGMFLAGLCTVGQFSFWGNYLPRVYPLHLRGTGESFAANIGGRMIGTSFAWVTTTIAAFEFVGGSGPAKTAWVAAGVALFVYAVNLACSYWLPEPGDEDTDEG